MMSVHGDDEDYETFVVFSLSEFMSCVTLLDRLLQTTEGSSG